MTTERGVVVTSRGAVATPRLLLRDAVDAATADLQLADLDLHHLAVGEGGADHLVGGVGQSRQSRAGMPGNDVYSVVRTTRTALAFRASSSLCRMRSNKA